MRRISYSNVAATLALLIAVSGGVVYAANRIGAKQIKRNAVRSKHIKNGQVKGPDVLESSLGSVPAADSVGGITQEPVSFAMTSPDDQGVKPLSIDGSFVRFSCTATEVELRVQRGLGGPPVIAQFVRNAASPIVDRPAPNAAAILQVDRVGVVGTIRESSGQITRLQADAFFLTNGYGGPEDCFVQGTIERFTG
jgi:hypothetical protein